MDPQEAQDEEENLFFQMIPQDSNSQYSIALLHKILAPINFVDEIDNSLSTMRKRIDSFAADFSIDLSSGKDGIFHLPRMLSSSPLRLASFNLKPGEIAKDLEESVLFPLIGISIAGEYLGYDKSSLIEATKQGCEALVSSLRNNTTEFKDIKAVYVFAEKQLAPFYSSIKDPDGKNEFWKELVEVTRVFKGDFENIPEWW
jgi:hypothetical protein